MSRCKACDQKLTEFELTRKSFTTGEYIDLCNHCFSYIKDDVEIKERTDLFHDLEVEDGEAPEECSMSEMCGTGSGSFGQQSGDV